MMRRQGRDSFDKKIPQAFLSGDVKTIERVLEGHADGDAHRPKEASTQANMSAVYATSSDVLMEQLRLGTLILGRPTHTYHQLEHQGAGDSPIWRLHEYSDRASKLRSRRELMDDVVPGLTFGTVRKAVPAGEAHVGCIEVEGNHNFFLADGTLVSNCDNVAAWRAAELRELGISARPYITWRQRADGGTTYHVVVLFPDGTHEDPSLLLGMGGAARAADRAEEERKLGERMGEFVAGMARTRTVAGGLQTMLGQRSTTVLGNLQRPSSPMYYYRAPDFPYGGSGFPYPGFPYSGAPVDYEKIYAYPDSEDAWRQEREYKKAALEDMLGVAINSPQNFNQLQYTIPFQTDDSYEEWSPSRPQAFYANPLYPNLPSTPGGGPLFNTRLRDPDEMDWEDKFDRFDGVPAHVRRHLRVKRRRAA
jgi:hypothetical protein